MKGFMNAASPFPLVAIFLCTAFLGLCLARRPVHATTGPQQGGPQTTDVSEKKDAVQGTGSIEGTVSAKRKKFRKDVVVYVEEAPGEFPPPKEHLVMDQKNLVFVPHVLPVLRGTTVDFLNSDEVRHNVFSPDNEKYNLGTWPQGKVRSYTYDKCGSDKLCSYTQLCNVHPEMEAFVVVLQNPYFAVTGDDGSFKIEKVPPGKYTVVVWSEKYSTQKVEVEVEAGKASQLTFELKK